MDRQELDYALDKFYNKIILVDLYHEYFRHWIEKGWVKTTIPATLAPKDVVKVQKGVFLDIIQQFYTNSDTCQKAYEAFPPAVQKALFQTTWHYGSDIPSLEKEFNITIATRDREYRYSSANSVVLEKPFRLLQYRGHYYEYGSSWRYYDEAPKTMEGEMYLPPDLCTLLKKHLPKPDNYYFHPVKNTHATFIHQASEEAVMQAELYYTYIKEGNVKKNAKTRAVLTTSIKTMQQYCQVNEFFSLKQCDYLKTAFIYILFSHSDPDKPHAKSYSYQTPADLLKQVCADFFARTDYYSLLRSLLPYLRGQFGYLSSETNIGDSFQKLLKAFPADESWITIGNLLDYITFRGFNFEIVNRWEAERYLYVLGETQRDYYSRKKHLEGTLYDTYLLTPFIKGLMFLMASVGILDIAYELPEIIGNEATANPFDNLKAVKLTKLGRYILGLESVFTETVHKDRGQAVLDEHTLTITLNGKNKIIQLALEKIGTKLTENRYQVDFASLFKECKTENEVKKKIELFKSKIPAPLPANWETFFSQALQQINPLETEPEYVVLRLKPDRQLIHLIASDEYLKRNAIKAEGYRILISKHKLPQVRNYLTQAGYFSSED